MNRALLLALFVLFALLVSGPALADVLHLKNGNKIEGKLMRETATHYFFKSPGLGEQPFKKSDVVKIEKGESLYDRYDKKHGELKKDDAEGWYQLGLWCKENKLRRESRKAYKAAVKADPDHAGARTALGYVKYEGEWITTKKRDGILAEIAKREGAVIDAMEVDEPYQDRKARIEILPPKGWERDAIEGSSVTFTGPELGKVKVVIDLTVDASDDDLAEWAESVTKSLKSHHEDLTRMGEPLAAKLAGRDAKHLTFQFAGDEQALERHEIVMVSPAGCYRLAIECRNGYFNLVKPFFDKIAASLKILERAADVEVTEAGFAYALSYPDDTYERSDSMPFNIQFGSRTLDLPEASAIISSTTNRGCFILVLPGKKDDGTADTTSLQTLRDSIVNLFPISGFLQLKGEAKTLKVAGQDALIGAFSIANGRMGNGRYCVFMRGDQYFRLAFLNFGGMGESYLIADFGKLLESFKFLDNGAPEKPKEEGEKEEGDSGGGGDEDGE